jgi:DNA-binding NarL/FixJ family response regulator
MSAIRVTLSDDHPVVLAGIKVLLSDAKDIEIVGEATTGLSARQIVHDLMPDIAIIDISLPGMGGIELTRDLSQTSPTVKVLALTVHEDRAYVQPMLQAGAKGYLLKRSAADELIRALHAIAEGGVYIDPAIAVKALRLDTRETDATKGLVQAELASRELEVLQMVARGFSNKEISIRLDVNIKTVETHRARAVAKLGLRNRADIVRYAASQGWLADLQ